VLQAICWKSYSADRHKVNLTVVFQQADQTIDGTTEHGTQTGNLSGYWPNQLAVLSISQSLSDSIQVLIGVFERQQVACPCEHLQGQTMAKKSRTSWWWLKSNSGSM